MRVKGERLCGLSSLLFIKKLFGFFINNKYKKQLKGENKCQEKVAVEDRLKHRNNNSQKTGTEFLTKNKENKMARKKTTQQRLIATLQPAQQKVLDQLRERERLKRQAALALQLEIGKTDEEQK